MSDASVRTARSDDLPAVGHVQALVWRDAFDGVVADEAVAQFTPEAFARVWQESLAQPPTPLHRLLVATELDAVVGFVAVGPVTPDSAEILAGGVHPEHRGRGHGSRLLNAAMDTLAANDLRFVRVRVLERDTPLVRFLATAGFAASGGFADRVVSADDDTVREIELHTVLSGSEDDPPHEHEHH